MSYGGVDLEVKESNKANSSFAIIDTGTSFLALPAPIHRNLMKALNTVLAENEFQGKSNCS